MVRQFDAIFYLFLFHKKNVIQKRLLINVLLFFRYRVPQREMDRRGGDRSQPLHTPAMAGGLFSIDKDYFYEIGKRQFDENN